MTTMSTDPAKLNPGAASAAPPFEIKKLGHVVIRVSDLQRSTDFYVNMLGLRVSDVYSEDLMAGRNGLSTLQRRSPRGCSGRRSAGERQGPGASSFRVRGCDPRRGISCPQPSSRTRCPDRV